MIKRSKRDEKYSVIDNEVFKSNRLTWEAQGLLANVLSKPDHWVIHPKALVKVTEGTRKQSKINAIYAILKELKETGFVRMVKLANGHVEYTIFDSPQAARRSDKPVNDYPVQAKPLQDNHDALVSTDSLVSTEEESNLKQSSPKGDCERAKIETTKQSEERGSIVKIFDYWVKTMKKNSSTKLTDKRKTKIRAILKDYDGKQICLAIKGCKLSPWHMGENPQQTKYNDLNNIFKDDGTIDKFIELATTPAKKLIKLPIDDNKLMDWASQNGARGAKAGESYSDYRKYLEGIVRGLQA